MPFVVFGPENPTVLITEEPKQLIGNRHVLTVLVDRYGPVGDCDAGSLCYFRERHGYYDRDAVW